MSSRLRLRRRSASLVLWVSMSMSTALAAPARAGDPVPVAPSTPAPPAPVAAPKPTVPGISADDVETRIRYLASDAMAGRFSTEPGAFAASQYVADEFARLGLEPKGSEGWFQPFSIPIPKLGASNVLEIVLADARTAFTVEKDWNPISFSPKADRTASLVFAGYGVVNPDKKYDDFAGIDVKGKAVLVLRREPPWDKTPSKHATFLEKLAQASKRGAAMLLVVNDPRSLGTNPDQLLSWNAQLGPAPGSGSIPYAFVSQAAAEKMLAPLRKSLAELQKAIDEAPGGPSALGCTDVKDVSIHLATSIERSSGANARNVCGLLPGTDPVLKKEVVIVGAHHDHVGRGVLGSAGGPSDQGKVHPGADDNASGTAAMLEIAEALALGDKKPRRSVLFLSFSGEEVGLNGSLHYVNHPTMPLEDVDVMINFDMIGRYDEKRRLEIGGVGTGEGLRALVEQANAPFKLALKWDPSGVAPSDNTSFYRKRIPVLFYFTGIHEDYHTPRDTADRINYLGAERVTSMCCLAVFDIADRDGRIVFTKPPPGAEGHKAALGIVPAPGSDSGGVVIGDVTDGGAAQMAGLAEGDVILAVGAYVVDNLRDLFKALSAYKPADKVLVKYTRGTEHKSVELVLGARK